MVGFVGFADLMVLPGGKDRDGWMARRCSLEFSVLVN